MEPCGRGSCSIIGISHGMHDKRMVDADQARSAAFDRYLPRLADQSMIDVAQALGMKKVGLAALH